MRVKSFTGKSLKVFMLKVVAVITLWVTILASTFGGDSYVEDKMISKLSCDTDVFSCATYGVYSAKAYTSPTSLTFLKLVYTGKSNYWEDGKAVKVVVFSKSMTQKEFLLLDLGISYSRFMEILENNKSHFIVVNSKHVLFAKLNNTQSIAVLEDSMVLFNQPDNLYYIKVAP